MYKLQRKLLSQNFLYSRKLVAKLVGTSSIAKNDLILEIGPGKGIITEQLIEKAGWVIAVELDKNWCQWLKRRFFQADNLSLYQKNFLDFPLPNQPYKVFANIPFSIEGKIIRKLIEAGNPPDDCYLVVNKKLASRLVAAYKENLFSISRKPFFNFTITYQFKKTDFMPMTSVECVIFRFTKKHNQLINKDDKFKYQQFVRAGFGQGLPIYRNLKNKVEPRLLNRAFTLLKIDKKTKPGILCLDKWIKLFNLTNT